jgi:plasmid stabilization system protein ParE
MFSIAVGMSGKEAEPAAEAVRRAISSAIAAEVEFPAPYNESAAAIRYREARYGTAMPPEGAPANPEGWLMDYTREIRAECAGRWAEWSIKAIEDLEEATESLAIVAPDQASAYLADIAKSKSIATRNRTFAACSRFYKWAVRTGRAKVNPFAGIKILKEEKSALHPR